MPRGICFKSTQLFEEEKESVKLRKICCKTNTKSCILYVYYEFRCNPLFKH